MPDTSRQLYVGRPLRQMEDLKRIRANSAPGITSTVVARGRLLRAWTGQRPRRRTPTQDAEGQRA